MSRHIRLHGRPLHVIGSSPPPLQLVGILPDYQQGAAYSGRLDIIDNIGPCAVRIIEDESYLPPGTFAWVDMANLNVVVEWPPYSPPDVEKMGIVNGDFQSGTLEGWHDLRGGSWTVKKYEDDDTTVGPGDRPRPPGNMAAWMEGFGRGDHILESDRYPVQHGQPIMARSLWDQGPSNKDNNNLWTALGLWNGDTFVDQILGDRIHDRTNKTRHWSTVNHTIPAGVTDITVRLIAHRRNGRNRQIIVDDVETSGLYYSVGTDGTEDFHITLRLVDSAGRVAFWNGALFHDSIWFNTSPYPVCAEDSISSLGDLPSMLSWMPPSDSVSSFGAVLGIVLTETVRYKSYNHPGSDEEAVETSGRTVGLSLESASRYVTYNHPGSFDESVSTSGSVSDLDLTVTAAYVSYENPADEVTTSGKITGITLS